MEKILKPNKQGGYGMKALVSRKGITLIELMIIVVIIGIVAAMAVPRFGRTISRLKFRNAARHMVSKLRLARSTAITNKGQFGVYFDAEGTTMTLFLDSHNPGSLLYETGDSVLSIDTLPDEFMYVGTDFGPTSVVYRPNGSASSTGNIYFLSYDGQDIVHWGSIDILAATGRTKMGQLYCY